MPKSASALFHRYPEVRLAVPRAELIYRQSWRSHGLLSLPVQLVS
ncbi:hypothetical protein V7968_14305 [Nocardia vulneris]